LRKLRYGVATSLDGFIAADVDERAGKELDDLGKDVLEKFKRALVGVVQV